jgi:hypothetical protein
MMPAYVAEHKSVGVAMSTGASQKFEPLMSCYADLQLGVHLSFPFLTDP